MRTIDTVYIDGQFVTPHGEELFDLFNPATEEKIAQVRLGDAIDAKAAVAAAKRAFPAYSRTSKSERIALLRRLHDAVAARTDVLATAMIEEYGAPQSFVGFSASRAANLFLDMAQTLEAFEFSQTIGGAEVTLKPIGVVAAKRPATFETTNRSRNRTFQWSRPGSLQEVHEASAAHSPKRCLTRATISSPRRETPAASRIWPIDTRPR